MASYKIISIDSTGAVVEIDFDTAQFQPVGKSKTLLTTQQFKFDGLRQDSTEHFVEDVELCVAAKLAEIDYPLPSQDILDLVGTENNVASTPIEPVTPTE